MIVLSVGMPRAGSGWHYNLIHDLMQTTGCAEAADIRRRFRLQRILTEVNCNIGALSARRLAMVTIPSLLGNTFVIKAHSRPTLAFRAVRAAGIVRTTYIFRDPRDAVLSAMDYGGRALQNGRPNAFSHLTDVEKASDFMMIYVKIWDAWMRQAGILQTRYEDLLQDYEAEAERLTAFLELERHQPAVSAVIDRYRPENAEGRPGTHYSKGRIGRFREAFTPQQQSALNGRLGPYLERMGYSA